MAEDTIKLNLDFEDDDDSAVFGTIQEYAEYTVKYFLESSLSLTSGSCHTHMCIYNAIKSIYESDDRDHGILVCLSLLNIGILHSEKLDDTIAKLIDNFTDQFVRDEQ